MAGREEEGQSDGAVKSSNPSLKSYTTIAIDIHGKVYDLSREHPSWEQAKKNKGKKDTGFDVCIVRNAFTCTIEECKRLKKKANKKGGKAKS